MQHTRKPRLNAEQRATLLASFVQDLTATQAKEMAGVNRDTANLYYRYFRGLIAAASPTPRYRGTVEIDQAIFGTRKRKDPKYAKYEQHREDNKVLVLGILKRPAKIYTHIIKKADRRTLTPIVHMVVAGKGPIYTDSWRAYNKLIFSGYKHVAVNHRQRQFVKGPAHINHLEGFWSFAKRRLSKFNGLRRESFWLHMKECEFRYNNKKDLAKALKRLIRLDDKSLKTGRKIALGTLSTG